MSFILDALKKSEAERKRQDAPGIASIPAPTENSSGSKWIWIIAGLLTVNVVVLTGVVLRPGAEPETEQPAVIQSATREQAEPQTAPNPVPTASAGDSGAAPLPQSIASPTSSTMSDAAPRVENVSPVAAAAQTGPSELPTFDELRTAGRLQLPDLHVDIHVYSGQSADRFVFVNMTKYRENEKLSEGPVVTRITPDGAELDYMGTAFLLPRE